MAQYELASILYETGDLNGAASYFEIWSKPARLERPRYSLASIYARTGRPQNSTKACS